ncbi:calcium homeostasis modulator protein 6-like isoform X1 [Clavelina lepadiformis]|uniref:calcium homeostasis modulator protein 6-like isoform X1 n=2 Tax=Clavelina lepadiformis TaxID=159417 RepID=UPI004041E8B5
MTTIKDVLQGLIESVVDHKATLRNIIVMLLTVSVNEIITVTTFQCPCVTEKQDMEACNSTDITGCVLNLNRVYGWLYLLAPAGILFVFGVTANLQVWKRLTGYCSDKDICQGSCSWCFWKVVGFAFIAPCVWVSVGLLQGEYYACATTSLPYVLKDDETCDSVTTLKGTQQYNDNLSYSQTVGWCLILVLAVATWAAYAISRCCHPMTYYKAKYNALYRQLEEDALHEAASEKFKETTKNNAKEFLDADRDDKKWTKALKILSSEKDVTKHDLKSCLSKNHQSYPDERQSPPSNEAGSSSAKYQQHGM